MGVSMTDSFPEEYIRSHITPFAFRNLLFIIFISILTYPTVASAAAVDISLAWNPSSNTTGYKLFYREDGQSYDYNSPAWQGVATTGTIYGVDDTKTYHFVVRAYNSYGDSGDSNEETWGPAGANNPPVLNTIGSKSVNEGVLLSFTVTASDPDGDGLTFSASNLPSGASFNPSTRVFSWTPAFGNAGNYNVTFTVTDNGTPAQSDSETVTITVGNVNRPPVLNTIGFKSVNEGDLLSFTISASDPDADILTYSVSNLPSGANFSSGTRTFSWTPAIGDAGDYNVQFTVTDNGSPPESDLEIITITVVDLSVGNLAPDQPVITSPYYGETETDLLLTVETDPFSDPDGDAHKESRWQIVKQQDSSVVLATTSSSNLTELSVPHAVLDRDTTYSVSVQFYDAYSAASEWSDAVTFTTDSTIVDFDGDGIPDVHEVDDTVDLNEDSIPDNDQPDVIKSILSAVGANEPFGVGKISASIDAIEALEPINPATILDKTNRPETFLFGLASYRLRLSELGATVLVRVYYSEDISEANQYYLYDTVNGWQDYTQYVTFNPDGRSVTVELKDGGHGDSDGVENGIIVDPGGVAGVASTRLDSSAGGGCFIATAAFGSYVEPHVKLQAASYLEEHVWLKPIVRVLLPPLARIFHELLSRDHADGRATWQPQGVGPEAYLNGTSQGPTPEDARKDGHIIRARCAPLSPASGFPVSWSQQVIHEISGLE